MRIATAVVVTLLMVACFGAEDVKKDDQGPADDLDKLTVGLKVEHDPSPVAASLSDKEDQHGKYTWSYKTTVSALADKEITIVEFGSYVWVKDTWVFSTYTKKPFTAKDFADWYSCPDAKLKPGKSFSDPKNWGKGDDLVESKVRWYFIGVNENGKRVKGEAIITQRGVLIE